MTRRESVWIVTLVFVSGQFDCPVGELKAEGIPAFAAPTLTHSAPFEDHMFSSELTEILAHGQPGMPAADDDRLDLFAHGDLL